MERKYSTRKIHAWNIAVCDCLTVADKFCMKDLSEIMSACGGKGISMRY